MNILLVDDSVVIRKMLRRVLAECAFASGSIFEATDGRHALTFLEAEGIDLVLCDVNMPVMGGHEFLQHARARSEWNTIPILMVTTEGSQESVLKALQLGANGYIRKPFTPDEVKQKIAESLKKIAA